MTRMLQPILDELLRRMTGADRQPPRPEDVVVAEVDAGAFDARGRPTICMASLRTPHEYEGRFATLMSSGYAWLNVSFYGFLDGRGVVVIERPQTEPAARCASTAVNLSGPPQAARLSSWEIRSHVVIEGSSTAER